MQCIERTELVFHPVFKTGSRRIKPAVAGSIPALSAQQIANEHHHTQTMTEHKEAYKSLPGVDTLLALDELQPLLLQHGKSLVTYAIRQSLSAFRKQIQIHGQTPNQNEIIEKITQALHVNSSRNLKKVYNASGIILHTNLGRAPFGQAMLEDAFPLLEGYNNLEFNLEKAVRGSRNEHAASLLQYLTGAEDILIVNNAAAAVMMILRAFAKNKEVIVSRGELIEIGGSFRIPDIMAASDCLMKEVGTTNKTRLSDYEDAIKAETGLLFKAHKSNYTIKGFTEEVSAAELSALGRKHDIPVLFDLGTGLLKKHPHPALMSEPDVNEALKSGVDLVCFSGDKLLGGPQAGIIAGKKVYIEKLKKEPMLRALRVCKTTLALLETACTYYLNEDDLLKKNLLFKTLSRKPTELEQQAEKLCQILQDHGITSQVVSSTGQFGGGTMPEAEIDSFALMLTYGKANKEKAAYASAMYKNLLLHQNPVMGILRKGHCLLDMLTIQTDEVVPIGQAVIETHQKIIHQV